MTNRNRARWWDLAVLAVCIAVAVPAAALRDVSGLGDRDALLLGAALIAFVMAYALISRPEVRSGESTRAWRRLVYFPLTAVILFAGVAFYPFAATLQAVVYPLAWVLSGSRREALAHSTITAVSVLIGYAAYNDFSATGWGYGAIVAGLSLAFAIAMGLWITRIVEDGRERTRLLAELTAAQERLAALERERGAAEERERLAREIHDTLAQTLAGLVLLAERAAQQAHGDHSATATIVTLEQLARDALAEARSLVARSAAVPAEPVLDAALERLAERFRIESGLAVEVRSAGDLGGLDRETQVVVLRCVQEALSNVRKHAMAETVRVNVTVTDAGDTRVEIHDDGRGFDPSARRTGFGLDGMRDRVALAGGELTVLSTDGQGTLLRAVLPAVLPAALPDAAEVVS